jgi:hypothetical protein
MREMEKNDESIGSLQKQLHYSITAVLLAYLIIPQSGQPILISAGATLWPPMCDREQFANLPAGV